MSQNETGKSVDRQSMNAIFASMADAVIATDLQGRITLMNRAAEKLSGLSSEVAEGRKLEDIFPLINSESDLETHNPVDQVLATGESIGPLHDKKLLSSEKKMLISDLTTPIRDREGNITGVVMVLRDIEKVITKKKNTKADRILRLFTEYSPAAIAMFDTEMRYVAASRRFSEDYRINHMGDLTGRSHYEIFPEIPERWKEIHRRALKGLIQRCEEDPFPRADGTIDWVRWEIRPWFDDTETIGGIILFSEVTTENRKMSGALEASEEKFRKIFEKHSAVKLIIDPLDGSIIDANEAAEKFYGWTKIDLRKKNISEINTLSRDEIKEEMSLAAAQQRNHFEFRHRIADGSTRDVEVYSSSIDINGRSLLHSIIHDITDRKLAEKEREKLREQLEQARKMESVGLLAGGVAHDYNNMLSVIIGYSELAMENTSEDNPLFENLMEIHDAAKKSADLTSQLLAFARKQTIKLEILDLNTTVKSMMKMLGRLIGEDIELIWIPGDSLWKVNMDPNQIDQILANLCINAKDAIAGVGKITIETQNVAFDYEYCSNHYDSVPGEFVLLAISDDGCGMTDEVMDHVFEPFFTTKDIGKGTGMGLATVYGIVKQNNGFINVYSEPDEGTTMKIYLPRYGNGNMGSREVELTSNPDGRGETLLLVEDEKAIMKMSRLMLEKLGYNVITASTPGEALKMVSKYAEQIDLLITDVVMPEMNGHDLAKQILEIHPETETLYMSGYTADVIALRGVLKNDINFIQKPFSKNELGRKVIEALGRKRSEHPS